MSEAAKSFSVGVGQVKQGERAAISIAGLTDDLGLMLNETSNRLFETPNVDDKFWNRFFEYMKKGVQEEIEDLKVDDIYQTIEGVLQLGRERIKTPHETLDILEEKMVDGGFKTEVKDAASDFFGGENLFVEVLALGNIKKEELRVLLENSFVSNLNGLEVKKKGTSSGKPVLQSMPLYRPNAGLHLKIKSKSTSKKDEFGLASLCFATDGGYKNRLIASLWANAVRSKFMRKFSDEKGVPYVFLGVSVVGASGLKSNPAEGYIRTCFAAYQFTRPQEEVMGEFEDFAHFLADRWFKPRSKKSGAEAPFDRAAFDELKEIDLRRTMDANERSNTTDEQANAQISHAFSARDFETWGSADQIIEVLSTITYEDMLAFAQQLKLGGTDPKTATSSRLYIDASDNVDKTNKLSKKSSLFGGKSSKGGDFEDDDDDDDDDDEEEDIEDDDDEEEGGGLSAADFDDDDEEDMEQDKKERKMEKRGKRGTAEQEDKFTKMLNEGTHKESLEAARAAVEKELYKGEGKDSSYSFDLRKDPRDIGPLAKFHSEGKHFKEMRETHSITWNDAVEELG